LLRAFTKPLDKLFTSLGKKLTSFIPASEFPYRAQIGMAEYSGNLLRSFCNRPSIDDANLKGV